MENSPTVGAAVASVAGGVGTVVGVLAEGTVGVLVGSGETSEVDVTWRTSGGGVDVASGVLDATVGVGVEAIEDVMADRGVASAVGVTMFVVWNWCGLGSL